MRHKPKVNERRLYTVTFFIHRSADCIADHCDLEALFEQIAEMCLDAQVSGGACHDYLFDPPLAQLQKHVVGRGTVYLMRAEDHCLAVVDIRLELLRKIGSRAGEALQRQG